MPNAETKFLMSPEHQRPIVNTASLPQFLLDRDIPDISTTFAPHLHLPQYKGLIADLRTFGDSLPPVPQAKSHSDVDYEKRYPGLTNPHGKVEVSRAQYFDVRDRNVKLGDFKIGIATEVETSWEHIFQQGNIPVLESHTHVLNTVLSPHDYKALLVSVDNKRVLKGVLAVGPNIATLALSTSHTPRLQPEQVIQLVEAWRSFLPGDQEKIVDLENQSNAVIGEALRRSKELSEELQRLPHDDEDARRPLINQVKEIGRKGEEDYWKLNDERADFIAMNLNAMHLDFAHHINVKLYSSSNGEDFYAFSA